MSNSINPPIQNSDAYPSPYDLPKLIWDKIETYFTKYGVDFRESKPQDSVTGPVIVWDIFSRVPGRPDSKSQTRGPTHSSFRTLTSDLKVIEELFQIHTVTYRFKVYSSSSEIANQIAWDLERLLPQACGIAGRQNNLPGVQLNFLRQTSGDESRIEGNQDDLTLRTLLFVGQVPVFYRKEHERLQTVQIETKIGRKLTSTGRVTRSGTNTVSSMYYPPTDSGQKAVGVFAVFKLKCETVENDTLLTRGADYTMAYDVNGLLYILWDDTYGNVPEEGEDFRVEYFVAATRITYPDLASEPPIYT